MTACRAGLFLACALFSTSASAQQTASTIHITGVVVDAQTSTPIRRARVDAGVTTTTWSASFTDDQGAFAVDVPRGAAALTFSKAGFAPERASIPAAEPREVRVSMNRAAAITGRVVDASGKPLVNLSVSLREAASGAARVRMATTNDLGEFRFGALPSGEFVIQSPIVADPVRLRPGDSFDVGAVVSPAPPPDFARDAAPRKLAITGTVWDEYDEPVQGAFVHVLRLTRLDDRLAALPMGLPSRTSDDRGSYRVFGLTPGRYLVVANVQGYADTYYAGATNVASATPLVVDRADVMDVDITFRPERTVRVSGTAVTSTGQLAAGAAVLLVVSQRSRAIMVEPKAAVIAPDGTFAFDNVPPGDYVVQVSTPLGGLRPKVGDGKLLVPRTEFGMQRLVVTDEQPPVLLLRTSPGTTVRGKVVADGITAPPRTLGVFPFPTDFDQSFAVGFGVSGLTRNDDGSFIITGVTGPRRFAIATPVPGESWYIKEARVRGVDALDAPYDFGLDAQDIDDVEIVVSQRGAGLLGTATTAGGEDAPNYAVLVFSTDSSKWHRYSQSMLTVRVPFRGQFRVNALPPGSYYVLALDGASEIITSGDWQDPAILEKLSSRASRITLGEGEQRTVALSLIPNP